MSSTVGESEVGSLERDRACGRPGGAGHLNFEMIENLCRDSSVGDETENPHGATTSPANENVIGKDSL